MCMLQRVLTLFPYTTLFRSLAHGADGVCAERDPAALARMGSPAGYQFPGGDARAGGRREHDQRLCHHLSEPGRLHLDRKSTRLNSSHTVISYAVFCLKKKK